MRNFRDTSIKNKLRIIILITSGIVLLLASGAFITNEMIMIRRNTIADLTTIAELAGLNSVGGLMFDDYTTVEENIALLSIKPHVTQVHIFEKENGQLVASYFRDQESMTISDYATVTDYYALHEPVEPNTQVEDNYFFHKNHLNLFKKIIYQDDFHGTIYVQADLKEFNHRLLWGAVIVVNIMLLSLLLAFLLASKLQKVITTPVFSLLKAMHTVSNEKNYSFRETKLSDDEIGKLVDGFNNMLSQIEMRDLELNQYRFHLEEKVVQRTAELEVARDQALAANKAKSIFLANMSHEIRTPMNAILGYCQILQRDSQLNSDQRSTLQIIEGSGNHLLGIINDILDISKIEAGAMELHQEDFYLDGLIDNIVDMFKIRCQEKKLEWVVENAVGAHTLVYSDQGKLRQILINLLGNAVKFTDKGEIRLRITPQAAEHKYRFDVIDTGRGISDKDQQNVFEPFQQERSGFDKGGTGLGLAITRRQVELMDGHISLVSKIGQGSQFTAILTLPPGQGNELDIQEPEQSVSHLADGFHVSALVVDDIEENRDILASILKTVGVDVQMAVNGQDALDQMHVDLPDIVFMDIRMPIMDGMTALTHIQSDFEQKVPCVAISASSLYHQTKRVIDAGFDHFLSKPFRVEDVYDCLDRYLEVKFAYEQQTTMDDEEQESTLDYQQITLPESLYSRIQEAAELSDLTELETIITELKAGDAQQQALADVFNKALAKYDVDEILEILEQINHD